MQEITHSQDIDPRAKLKSDLGPEHYKLLENVSHQLKIPMPTDEDYQKLLNPEYSLAREYSKDEQGNIVLNEDEKSLLEKYEITPSKDIKELNSTLINLKTYESYPLELKEEILNTLGKKIDSSYCNRDDVKNMNQPEPMISKSNIAIATLNVAVPGSGIFVKGIKDAWNETSNCAGLGEKALNSLGGGVLSAIHTVIPFSDRITNKISKSFEETAQERKKNRMLEIENGAIPTEDEVLKSFSDGILNFKSNLKIDKQNAEISKIETELQKMKAESEAKDAELESPKPVPAGPRVQPIGNLQINASKISLERIEKFSAEFEAAQNATNENTNDRRMRPSL